MNITLISMSEDAMTKKVLGNTQKIKDLIDRTEKLGRKMNQMDEELSSLRKENRELRKELGGVKKVYSILTD